MKNALSALGRFLRTVIRSCYDMELYRGIRVRTWPPALRYFVWFNLLVVVLTLFDLVPTAFSALGHVKRYVADKIPAGAALTVRAGVLETTLPTPYNFGDDKTQLVVDTSVSGMDARPAMTGDQGAIFGRDAVYIKRSENDRQVVAMKELPDVSLSRESVLAWLDRSGGWLAAGAVTAFAVVYFLVSLASGVIFVLLASLLASLFGALWRIRLNYSQWLAVGFHAVTLPTLINALFDEFGMSVPMVFSFLFFMVIVAVIADERAAPTSPPPAAPEKPAEAPEAPPAAASEGGVGLTPPPPAAPKKPRAAKKPVKPRVRRMKAAPPAEPSASESESPPGPPPAEPPQPPPQP